MGSAMSFLCGKPVADRLSLIDSRSAHSSPRLGAALRERAVLHERPLEERLHPGLERLVLGVFELDEDIVARRVIERVAELSMCDHAREAGRGEHLVGREREGRGARLAEETYDAGEIVDAEEEHVEPAGHARELEGRLRDDAEGPLGPDEELAQVEPRVVLLEGARRVEYLPAREHDLQAEHPLARQTPANDLHSARVRRDVPADGRRPLRREVDRPGQPRRRAVLVHGLRDRAGLDAHGPPDDVHRVHRAHLRERQRRARPAPATAPPASPVRPPLGTMATRCDAQTRTIPATSSVLFGKATAHGAGSTTRVQSFPYSARSPGSRVTASCGSARARSSKKAGGGGGRMGRRGSIAANSPAARGPW